MKQRYTQHFHIHTHITAHSHHPDQLMAAPLRSLGHRTTFPSSVQGALWQTTTRLPHSAHRTAATANAHLHTNSGSSSHDDQEDTSIRERAIKAREPSYAGWWTEVMNYRTTPQTSVDPSAPSIPNNNNNNNNATTTPSADEIKKGYGNTLPRARPSLEYNTLPRAASTGSATFVTGTGSTLSAPAAESTDYHGFKVPVKPSPPGAEDCCMRYASSTRRRVCIYCTHGFTIIQARRFFVLENFPDWLFASVLLPSDL